MAMMISAVAWNAKARMQAKPTTNSTVHARLLSPTMKVRLFQKLFIITSFGVVPPKSFVREFRERGAAKSPHHDQPRGHCSRSRQPCCQNGGAPTPLIPPLTDVPQKPR